MSGIVYYPDGASFQSGINLTGWHAYMAKATEGTGYSNPAYAAMKAEAARRGARFGAYHFLHHGNGAAQADWCHAIVGSGVPVMIDHEPTGVAVRELLGLPQGGNLAARAGEVSRWPEHLEAAHLERLDRTAEAVGVSSRPTVQDAVQFTDRFRALGGTCWLAYLPRWYWQQLGSPSLQPFASRGLELVTSNYTGNPEEPGGPGWQTYGGMPPVRTWQYSASGVVNGRRPVDLNAFRGSGSGRVEQTLAELWSLWTTGRLAGGAAPPASHPVIRLRSSGSAVILAQQRLNVWGARPQLAQDGDFGVRTAAAAEAFQRGHSLAADGVIGPATWAALMKNPAS